MAERTGATFPIGYGLKVPEDADKVGAYWEERRGIIHATASRSGRIEKFSRPALPPAPSAGSQQWMR
jgi:hypothetical protein